MYIQPSFAETRIEVLHTLIRSHPLGTFVVLGPDGIEANHFPFFIDASVMPYGVLRGHIPKANLIWKDFCNRDVEAMVIFQGEEAYITPSWYATKHEHGKVAPTWNYATVHAYGQPRFIHDHDWLLSHVTELTSGQEAEQAMPWKVTDAPAEYVDGRLDHIVGVELLITRILGKWKMSQNRSPADQSGVIAGLNAQQTEKSMTLARLVKGICAKD
jgi:transcriptional regulator